MTASQDQTIDRITVNLNRRASEALTEAAQLTGDRKTDVVNKALLVYLLFQQTQTAGGTIFIQKDPEDGGLERIRLL